MIKAITFDMWGTLIKSNPMYKEARAKFLSKYTDIPENEIEGVFRRVKNSFDEQVEKHGLHFDNSLVYNVILKELGVKGITPVELEMKCNELFQIYPPIIYSEDTVKVLEDLHCKDYEMVLISNTVLIKGYILRNVLKELELFKYFKHLIFSDDVECSKPDIRIFNIAHNILGCMAEQVLHVGDNKVTDKRGAENYGFKAVLINTEFLPETYYGIYPKKYDINIIYKYLEHYNGKEV
jgi:putative hydrolase of the HAD superfamily